MSLISSSQRWSLILSVKLRHQCISFIKLLLISLVRFEPDVVTHSCDRSSSHDGIWRTCCITRLFIDEDSFRMKMSLNLYKHRLCSNRMHMISIMCAYFHQRKNIHWMILDKFMITYRLNILNESLIHLFQLFRTEVSVLISFTHHRMTKE